MRKIPLSSEEQLATGFNWKIHVTHEDLTETATATAQVLELLSVQAGDYVDRAALTVITAFSDASDNAFNDNKVTVGDGNDADRFFASNTAGTGIQVNVNGTEVLDHINPVAASTAGLATAPFMYTGADTVDLTFGSMTGKSLVDLDGGELVIWLKVGRLRP